MRLFACNRNKNTDDLTLSLHNVTEQFHRNSFSGWFQGKQVCLQEWSLNISERGVKPTSAGLLSVSEHVLIILKSVTVQREFTVRPPAATPVNFSVLTGQECGLQ